MATKKITELTNVTSVQDSDLLIVETSEGTRSINKGNIIPDALLTTGGTLTGDLNIQHSDKTESKVRVVNSLHDGNFTTSVNGNFGIYDNTYTKWIVRSDPNGVVNLFGTANDAKNASGHVFQIYKDNNSTTEGGELQLQSQDGTFWKVDTVNDDFRIFDSTENIHIRLDKLNPENDYFIGNAASANNSDTVDGYHVTASTNDLTAGSSSLATNTLYFVYE